MRSSLVFFGGAPLPSHPDNEFWTMIIRVGLFMLFLLVFVFVCGYAWRTLPGLKALLPPAEKRVREELHLTFKPLPIEPSEGALSYYTQRTSEQDRPGVVPGAAGSVDPLAVALADGRPGTVVQAAGEPGAKSFSPIIIVRREEPGEPAS